MKQERGKAEDLGGRKFGRLTVLYRVENRRDRVCWRCRCDCGRYKDATAHDLKAGRVKSCGCLKKENQKIIHDQLHFVDGTCLEMTGNRKYRRDNVSGFRGVFQTKGGRWRVSIGFKGKRYYIGSYDSYDEAVRVRVTAEEQIYTGFINGYREWQEKAEKDPEWADENPFLFEVEKSGGELKIISG